MVTPEHQPPGLNHAVDGLVQALEQLQPDSLCTMRAMLAKVIAADHRTARLGGAGVCEAQEHERVWSALEDLLTAVEARAHADDPDTWLPHSVQGRSDVSQGSYLT
jgi:hypothetical protein